MNYDQIHSACFANHSVLEMFLGLQSLNQRALWKPMNSGWSNMIQPTPEITDLSIQKTMVEPAIMASFLKEMG